MVMKKLIFLIAPFVFLLSACADTTAAVDPNSSASTSPSSTDSVTAAIYGVPSSCKATSILATISPLINGAKFIDSKWQPAAGTELADFLNNGGIACSYGNAPAEIGTTVKWVSKADSLFSNRVADWNRIKYSKIDLPDFDESAAYFLYKPVGPTQEFQIWALNILIGGTWIQINASYLHDIESGTSLIQSAIDSSLKN